MRSSTKCLRPSRSLATWIVLFIGLAAAVSFGCGGGSGAGTGSGGRQTEVSMTGIRVTPDNSSIGVGAQQQFTATAVFSDGSTSPISDPVNWTSSDSTLAGITGSGLATATSIGRVQVTATVGSLTAATRLIVTAGNSLPVARFAYASNDVDNTVSAYVVDSTTGQLRPNGYVLSGTNPSALVVEPRGKFLYVANLDDDNVSAYSVDQVMGALSPVQGSPFPTDTSPGWIAIDPSWTFAFVANSNSVSAFSIDAGSGALAPVPGSPFSIKPGNLTVDPHGKTLYVGGTPYSIDVETGALTLVHLQTVAPSLTSLAIAPSGNFAFAPAGDCTSGIRAFSVDPTSGALDEVSGSPFSTSVGYPSGFAVDPSGKFLYAADFGSCSPHELPGAVSSFSISAAGALAEISSIGVPFGPVAIHLDPKASFGYVETFTNEIEIVSMAAGGQLNLVGATRARLGLTRLSIGNGAEHVNYTPQSVYAVNTVSNDVSIYAVDSGSGALTSKGSVPIGAGPRGIVVAPFGKFAYVANQGSNDVSMYSVDASSGMLVPIGTVPAGTDPGCVTEDPSGRFVYVGNLVSNDVSMFTVNPASGNLTANGTIPAGTTPFALAVDPTGRFLLVANQDSSSVSVYSIDKTTGSLTGQGTLNVGSFPVSIAFHPSGRFFYLSDNVNEISTYAIVDDNGLTASYFPYLQSIGTLTAGVQITPVTVDPTGRFAYAGDVVSNDILIYTIDMEGGALSPVGSIASEMYPESVSIDPSGAFAYATNQNSNSVSMYAIDANTGTLTSKGSIAAGNQPLFIVATATMR